MNRFFRPITFTSTNQTNIHLISTITKSSIYTNSKKTYSQHNCNNYIMTAKIFG